MYSTYVNVKEIESKVRSKKAMKGFFGHSLGLWFPDDNQFTTDFGLLVMAGKKNC